MSILPHSLITVSTNDANDNDMKAKDIQRNESLDRYRSLPQRVLVLVLPGMQ